MRRLLRPFIVGVLLAMVALTGHASAVAPMAAARALWRDLAATSAQSANGGGQTSQPRQGGDRSTPPAEQNAPADKAPPASQPPPADPNPQNPLFRTGIDFVRVDVIASDRSGNAITDLKQSDFEVTEDGKPQRVETFKLVKLDGGVAPTPDGPPRAIRNDADEETEAAKDDVRLFSIFLDDYHVKEGSSLSARAAISKWVDTNLGPSDMIGVMRPLESIEQVRMTRNHSAIARAVQQFRGRKGDYTPQNDIEQQYANYPAETVEQIRNQVSLSAIKALIVHMGGLKEGRKALILVSEGYSNILPASLRSLNAQFSGLGGGGGASANDPNEQRYAFFAGQDLEFYMQGVYEVANQYNVAIYAVDPRGLPVFEFDIDKPVDPGTDRAFLSSTQNTLRALAVETDGRAILNRNDLDVGMKQIIEDSSAYYLIGYTSTQAKSDGKFHAIGVKVKRPGVQLRSRKGYWAVTAPVAEAATVAIARKMAPPTAVDLALTNLASAVQPKGARVVRTWIGTSRGQNGKTKVTFVWEPSPKAPGDRPTSASDLPARILVTAVAPDGSPSFRARVPERVASAPEDPGVVAARGPSRATFELNPGKIQLRLSVEGAASQVLDTEIREFTVPDLTSAQVVIGTPEVFRARALRDFTQMKADPDAVPVATREFSRTERVMLRVAAYAPGSATPTVTARLLNRAGTPMNDLTVTPPGSPVASYQMELSLSGLAPGEYVVEIKAAAEGGGEARELVGFRLTS